MSDMYDYDELHNLHDTEEERNIMNNPLKGTIIPISDYGVGKTIFTLTSGISLSDTIFIADDKEPPINTNLFKQYFNLSSDLAGKTQLEVHDTCLKLIEKLPKVKVIVWDTWTRFEKTMIEYVEANPKVFRDKYRGNGAMVGAAKWGDAADYEISIINQLRNKCDLLFLTFHIKQQYDNNGIAQPGKMQPGHNKAISRVADLRLWLTPNPSGQVPTGLVLKNISKFNDGEFQQILPLRLEHCSWQSILEYYDNPAGMREVKADEKPSEFELSLIQGFLTLEQQRLYEKALDNISAIDEAKKELEEESNEAIITRARELEVPSMMAIKILEKEFDIEVTEEHLAEWRNE